MGRPKLTGPKRCPRCGETKPRAEFTMPSGRVQGYCKPCRNANQRDYLARGGARSPRATGPKRCPRCGELFPRSQFYRNTGYCAPCHRAAQRAGHYRRRAQVLQVYGTSCACCGETEEAFLVIDHVDGGGRRHRSQSGWDLYRWLVRNGFPEGFQTLCANCNMAKERPEGCPHQHRALESTGRRTA